MSDETVTGDDSCYCGICGKETSLAMIAMHLERDHEIDPAELADAPIITEMEDDDEGAGSR